MNDVDYSIIEAQLSIDPMDLYSLKFMTEMNIESVESAPLKAALHEIMDNLEKVTKQGIGEGVYIYQDGDVNNLKSRVSSGHAVYAYVTDGEVGLQTIANNNYEEIIVDIIGQIKDGDIKSVELFSRRMWNNECGDVAFDHHLINYSVPKDGGYKTISASDKENMLHIVNPDSSVDNLASYVDYVQSIEIEVDDIIVDESDDKTNYLIVQDRLDGKIYKQHFNNIEETIDTISNNMLLKLLICK